LADVRRILTALGLSEAQGQTLISSEAAGLLGLGKEPLALRNPLSGEMNLLRHSLLPGLLTVLQHNATHQNPRIAVFEVGRVFLPGDGEPREQRRLALAFTGLRSAPFWTGEERTAHYDFYDLKGVLDEFCDQFGIMGLAYQSQAQKMGALYIESASILSGKQVAGETGQVLPPLARRYDLRAPVFLAELDLDLILSRRSAGRGFKALPLYPSVRRDVALLVPEGATHEQILTAVRQAKPDHLVGAELFDVFRGQGVPSGRKSVAYAFTYRHGDRTLTDAEVNAAHEKIVDKLRQLPETTIR